MLKKSFFFDRVVRRAPYVVEHAGVGTALLILLSTSAEAQQSFETIIPIK